MHSSVFTGLLCQSGKEEDSMNLSLLFIQPATQIHAWIKSGVDISLPKAEATRLTEMISIALWVISLRKNVVKVECRTAFPCICFQYLKDYKVLFWKAETVRYCILHEVSVQPQYNLCWPLFFLNAFLCFRSKWSTFLNYESEAVRPAKDPVSLILMSEPPTSTLPFQYSLNSLSGIHEDLSREAGSKSPLLYAVHEETRMYNEP